MSKVTEQMVEAAIKAYENAIVSPAIATYSEFMRAALEAALSQGEAVAWLIHWSSSELESPELTRNARRVAEIMALYKPPRVEPLYLHPQPAPQSEPAVELVRYGCAGEGSQWLLEPMADGYWTPWHIAAAALTATGKQSGSEDAWSIAERVRTDLDRQSCPDHYMRVAVESVVKHITAQQAATASRETVVPDGVWEALQRIIENSALYGPASNEDAILVAKYRKHLLAPPAQGVDLGQFRRPIEEWREDNVSWANIVGDTRGLFAADVKEADRLLALIDQRDGEVNPND